MNKSPKSEGSRVGLELRDMYHQFMLGSLLGTILRVLIDVVAILVLTYITYTLLENISPASQCVFNAFNANPKKACFLNTELVFRLLPLLLSLAIGSYYSTKLKSSQKFQHSSSVTAGLLVIIIGSMLVYSYPFFSVTCAFVAIFLSTYFGYRFWFYLRDRKKHTSST